MSRPGGQLRVRLSPNAPAGADAVAVPVWSGRRLVKDTAVEFDRKYLAARGFEGQVGETHVVDGSFIAVGLGEPAALTPESLRRAAAAAARAAGFAKKLSCHLLDAAPDLEGGAQAVAEGIVLAAYEYTALKSSGPRSKLTDAVIVADKGAKAGLERGVTIANAVCLARDLINEPAGDLTPSRLAEVAADVEGLSVLVLDRDEIIAAGLGGLAGVARGSEQPARLIELLYEPPAATEDTPTLALVGKGITFDSGGLSLKTGTGMMTMKTDMSGAAAVIASMGAIAALGADVRVLGLCPTTENMPSGSAIRPGDVLHIRNGKTVEVLNTDAEGRLVLADGLSLAAEAGVDAIVDIATLTGAVSTALGRNIAGLMANDDGWRDEVSAASERAGEATWPLPLPPDYRRELESEVADLRNIGTSGTAGTIIAALFLNEFTDGVPWAHLDIAGVARSESSEGYTPKGGTGSSVRTLIELATTGAIPVREGATRRARWKGDTPVARLRA